MANNINDLRRLPKPRARSGRAVIGVLTVLSLSACTASGSADNPPELDQVAQELIELRGPNGLIRMPEAGQGSTSDLYPTALYLESIGDTLAADIDSVELLNPALGDPQQVDALTLWSAVEIQSAIGGMPTAELRNAIHSAVLPGKQETVDAEIGVIWLWADLIRSASEIEASVVPGGEEARKRLASIPIETIREMPYLLWRIYDAYDALDMQPSADLIDLLKAGHIESAPKSYEEILDVQGILEARASLETEPDLPPGLTEHLISLLDSETLREDVLVNSVMRSLELLGATSQRDSHAEKILEDRQDASTGILTQASAKDGSVQGTYLAARLVDTSFPMVANADTVAALSRVLDSTETDTLTQLKALVALKRSNQYEWQDHISIINSVVEDLPDVVGPENLQSYLLIIEPIIQLAPDIEFPILTEFPIDMQNADSMASGLSALSNAPFFANSNEVRSMFPELQAKMPEIIETPTEPAGLYYKALTAMTSAAKSGLGSEDFDRAAAKLGEYRGCSNITSLYRIGFTKDAPCSLTVSAMMIGVPGAYTLGVNP